MLAPKLLFAMFIFLLTPYIIITNAQNSSATCSYEISTSNNSYALNSGGCVSYNVSVLANVENTDISCSSRVNLSGIYVGSNTHSNAFYNCSFLQGSEMVVQNNSDTYLISPANKPDIFINGSNSSVTVGYYLHVNVFEPYGYNSTSIFLNRVAGFGYLFPTINNTMGVYQTELTPNLSSSSHMAHFLKSVSEIVPFGVYNQSQTEIYENLTNTSYGKIIGAKTYKVASYTVYNNRTVNYNPYSLVYTFFAYDQLIYFSLNITGDMNLTPLYIQPISPKFNYYILPDNGGHDLAIKWLVAVPPQDLNWNFTTLLYRYNADLSFTLNPLNASSSLYGTVATVLHSSTNPPANSLLGPQAYFAKVLQVPNSTYSYTTINGTRLYVIKYDANLPVSKNSSITMSIGYGGRNVSYLQDSTTPTFGFGLSFCATEADSTQLQSKIDTPGYYDSVSVLYPISQRGPLLDVAPCNVSVYVTGQNIYLNCKGAIMNDQLYGIGLNGARNITINGCNIYGNGLLFNNASEVRVMNTTITPSQYNDSFAVKAINSYNISLSNVLIARGYITPMIKNNSTLYTYNVIYNSTPQTTTSITTTIPEGTGQRSSQGTNTLILYVVTALVASVYIIIFLKQKSSHRKKFVKAGTHGKEP